MELKQVYRQVFSTREGKIVLADILNDCGFFSLQDVTQEDVIRLNVARRILGKMGIWSAKNIVELAGLHTEEKDILKSLLQLED